MIDIAARLRNDGCVEACLCEEAAAEIERLRAALAEALDSRAPDYADAAHPGWSERARRALEQSTTEKP